MVSHWNLNPACLPIPPCPHSILNYIAKENGFFASLRRKGAGKTFTEVTASKSSASAGAAAPRCLGYHSMKAAICQSKGAGFGGGRQGRQPAPTLRRISQRRGASPKGLASLRGTPPPTAGTGRWHVAVNDRRYGPVRAGNGGRLRAVPPAGAGGERGASRRRPLRRRLAILFVGTARSRPAFGTNAICRRQI